MSLAESPAPSGDWATNFIALVGGGFVLAGADSSSESDPQSSDTSDQDDWPNPANEMANVARVFLRHCEKAGYPVLYWEGSGWFIYTGTHYMQHTHEEFENLLYKFFLPRKYTKLVGQKRVPTSVLFNPDSAFLKKCRESIRAQAIAKDLVHDSWLDGRKDRVIPLRNGLLSVEDRVLLDHTPHFFNTYCLPFDYDPHALEPGRWMRFLDEAWPDDFESHALLQEWFGYVLSGRTDLQKMMMLIGVSRSGKGTIARLLEEMISPAGYISLSSRDLAGDFGLQPMIGKSLAVFSDDRMTVRGSNVVENILRITGEDQVTANRKNATHWTGTLKARLMFMSNEVPTFPDASQAITNRILSLYMGRSWQGEEDPRLLDELRLELPGIFNWALIGARWLSTNGGRFTVARSAARVGELLRAGASPLAEFVDSTCVLGPERWVSKDELFERWRLWCMDAGHQPGSKEHFSKKLFAAYGNAIGETRRGGKGAQVRGYGGIDLKGDRRVTGGAAS